MPLIDFPQVLLDHLEILKASVHNDRPSTKNAIQASISLRFTMDHQNSINSQLFGAPFTPEVEAPDYENIPFDSLIFFVAGGFELGDTYVRPYFELREPGTKSPFRAQFESDRANLPERYIMKKMKISKFLEQKCIGFGGHTYFSRSEIIRFVANKCGGAHYDENLKENQENIKKIGRAFEAEKLSAVLLEVLGSAYFVVRSRCFLDLTQRHKSNIIDISGFKPRSNTSP